MPSRNRTLDSEVLGRNVGLPVNDTRLEVFVDFEKEADAQVRPERSLLVPVTCARGLMSKDGWVGGWVGSLRACVTAFPTTANCTIGKPSRFYVW